MKRNSVPHVTLSASVSQELFDVIEVQSGLVGWTRGKLVEHILADWISRLDEHGGSIMMVIPVLACLFIMVVRHPTV